VYTCVMKRSAISAMLYDIFCMMYLLVGIGMYVQVPDTAHR